MPRGAAPIFGAPWTALVVAATVGCGVPAVPVDSGGADGDEASTTEPATTLPSPPDPSATSTTAPSLTSASGDSDSDSDSDSDEGSIFLTKPDGGPSFECNIGLQDCDPGWKCMPYSTDGSSWWNASACFPIVPAPVGLGEPCHWEGGVWSGYDDCGWAQVCWSFSDAPGVCKGLCLGSDSDPTCEDPSQIPYVGCQDCFCVCETPCDPLAQTCDEGQVCYFSSYAYWLCAPDASGDLGAYGDPCDFVNQCDPGLACLDAAYTPGCEDAGCCTSYCDLTQPNTCPGAAEGQQCLPWYEDGGGPTDLQHLGVCAIPER